MILLFSQDTAGVIYTVVCKPTDTVTTLKGEVGKAIGIAASGITLVFSGRPMLDDKKLSFYRMQDSSTIHVVRKQQGGSQ